MRAKEAEFPELRGNPGTGAGNPVKGNRQKVDGPYRRYGAAQTGNRLTGIRTA